MSITDFLLGASLVAYVLALSYVTVYCLLQLHLLLAFLRRAPATTHAPLSPAQLPRVTVQLPLYNELYVATRIIDAVAAFDYPRSKLQIQVLDDSTDATVDIVAKRVAQLSAEGYDIQHVRRPVRRGYKAGALADALATATGEFVAVFDADFVPEPDFLQVSIPCFDKDNVGVVQSRWEHLNEAYSIVTRLQALQLNVHFTVEQAGRRAADLFAQFNGTAGVWRRTCIDDAGGWRALTLTEDLDLSIRAQLRGWTITYLDNNPAPAELPAEMNALKSQQHRWMKGGAECARVLLPQVWAAPHLTLGKKLHSTAHLFASSIFVFVCLIGILSLPTSLAVVHFALPPWIFTGFLVATVAVAAVYYVGNVVASWGDEPRWPATLKFVLLFPMFLSLSMGLSLHNGVAVLQGFWGKRTPFVRTPKFNLAGSAAGDQQQLAANAYRKRQVHWTTVGEGVLAVLFAAAVVWGVRSGNTYFILFHAMLAIGYGSICFITLRHASIGRRGGSLTPEQPSSRLPQSHENGGLPAKQRVATKAQHV